MLNYERKVNDVHMGNGKAKKYDKMTIGAKGEVIPYDFTDIGVEAAPIIAAIHKMAFTEFASRPIINVEEWSQRVVNIFMKNEIKTIGDVIFAKEIQVQRLIGCGKKARNEIYEAFLKYGLKLNYWSPDRYWMKEAQYTRKVEEG